MKREAFSARTMPAVGTRSTFGATSAKSRRLPIKFQTDSPPRGGSQSGPGVPVPTDMPEYREMMDEERRRYLPEG